MEHGQLEKTEQAQSPPPVGKVMLKRAACCGGGVLGLLALGTVGPSLGALATGALSLVAVLACPLGMYFMMRAMMKQPGRQAQAVPSAREEVVEGEVIEVKPMGVQRELADPGNGRATSVPEAAGTTVPVVSRSDGDGEAGLRQSRLPDAASGQAQRTPWPEGGR